MANRRSKEDLKNRNKRLADENQALRQRNLANSLYGVARYAIVFSSLIWIMSFVRDVGLAWAGQVTLADVNVGTNVALGINAALASALVAALGWGGYERRLRKNAVNHLQERTTKLEQQRDSRRSSSMLTSTGDTRPEDKE